MLIYLGIFNFLNFQRNQMIPSSTRKILQEKNKTINKAQVVVELLDSQVRYIVNTDRRKEYRNFKFKISNF